MSRPDIFRDLVSQWMGTSTQEEIDQLITQLEPVESSNLAAVGYDPTNEWLEIAFLDGSVYRYYKVPEEEYQSLMEAPSHGTYFYWHIRESYAFERLIG